MGEKKQHKTKTRYYFTREIARSAAKKNMKKAGFSKLCKRERRCLSPRDKKKLGTNKVVLGRSTFSNQWRMYVMQH